jgi:hypothetical protein
MATNKTQYLDRCLKSHKIRHVQTTMDKYITKREEVKNALGDKYADKKAVRATNSGSFAKHSAINEKFDIDICQPFKRNSFATLEEMADSVFDYFYSEFQDEQLIRYKTRKQRVSIGLTFLIDGEEIGLDVVPGRELLEGDYSETNRLNLYVRPKGFDPATSTQTNIQAHVDHIKGKGDERKIIRLLKVWKLNKGKKEIKSFFVELLTIKAFDCASSVPTDLWEKLKMVLAFIRDNVKTIKLTDPANSNNIVSNTMTDTEKANFADDADLILKRIDDDSDNIKIYFPVNDKYDDDQKSAGGAAVLGTKSFS